MQSSKKFCFLTTRLLLLLLIVAMPGCTNPENRAAGNNHETSYWQKVTSWARALIKGKSNLKYDMATIFDKENVVPLVVIGSGPAGLGAALYGARDNTTTLVIEGSNPGGLLMYTTDVENWAGAKKITGPEIIKELREHVVSVGTHFLADTVEKVDFSQWPFVLTTMGGKTINALSVVIATGASPKKLHVPGEETYWGRGVTACAVCDARFFKGEDVVVVGGGDSAIESAIQLANHVNSVTILVRSNKMRAAASMQDRLKEYPTVSVRYNVSVREIKGNDESEGKGRGKVTSVELVDNATNAVSILPTAGVFLAVGHSPNSQVFEGQLDINEHGNVVTFNGTHKTSVQGVFAAGEIEDYRYRQAWSSGGRGTEAALDALAFLRSIGFTPTVAEQLHTSGSVWSSEPAYEIPSLKNHQEFVEASSATDKPIILDFWAEDCPNCISMLPTVGIVAKAYQNKAHFYKVDAAGELDTVSDLVTKFHITKIPTLLVFKNGQIVGRYTGSMNKKQLTAFVDTFLIKKAQ
jgi:thioredoxin reductase (NADPH)